MWKETNSSCLKKSCGARVGKSVNVGSHECAPDTYKESSQW